MVSTSPRATASTQGEQLPPKASQNSWSLKPFSCSAGPLSPTCQQTKLLGLPSRKDPSCRAWVHKPLNQSTRTGPHKRACISSESQH